MRQGPSGRRPRGRPHRKQHGGPPRSNSFDSNGPDGRIRGNAHQVYEKYVGLARDALSSGDRLSAESFFQHAEHYFRILNDSTDPRPNGQGQQGRQDGNGRAEAQHGGNGADAPRAAQPMDGPAPVQPALVSDQTVPGEQPVLDERVPDSPAENTGEPRQEKPRRRRVAKRSAETDKEDEAAPSEPEDDSGEKASGTEPVSA